MDTQHHTVTTGNTASSLSPLNTYLVSVQQEVLSTHQHTTRPVSPTRHGYEHVGAVVHWVTPLAQDVVKAQVKLVVGEVLLSRGCSISTGVLCVAGLGLGGGCLGGGVGGGGAAAGGRQACVQFEAHRAKLQHNVFETRG